MYPVTVVLPTKNEAHNIPHFLKSLPPEVPLLVLDDSSDGTAHIIKTSRPHNTRVLTCKGNVAQKRQAGLQLVSTPWVLHTDADVVFPRDYFQKILNYLQKDGFYGPKLSAGGYEGYYRLFSFGQRVLSSLGFPAASGSNLGLRREAALAVGGFNTQLNCNEDTDLVLRMVKEGVSPGVGS